MFIDARTIPQNRTIEAEVCIVGGGAAGITLAREFIGLPFRVCLLESGGLKFDKETQALYQGENVGLPYFGLDSARLRFFGGSTNHWGGWCRPLDEIDFEVRDWIPYSGWPFSRSVLEPYYKRAQTICHIGPFSYAGDSWETNGNLPSCFNGSRVRTQIYQLSPPVRFGSIYRDEISRAENISTYLHANVIDIETFGNGRSVRRVRVACLQGNRFWVSGKLFILAAGGIENPRLLLLSNKTQSHGLGNQNGLVGRFFMEHPHLPTGLFLPTIPLATTLYHGRQVDGLRIRGVLTLATQTMRRERLANFSATLQAQWSESIRSLLHLYAGKRDELLRDVINVISDLDDVVFAVYGKLAYGFRTAKVMLFENRTEQVPNPESRITLSEERDRLGKNRVCLNWRLSSMDKRSIRRAQEIVAEEVGRVGAGRVMVGLDDDVNVWPVELSGGNHHMGTTRMHVDPKSGVVNEHCRVHGISNLFIAGSSVFPTSGSANPTLTIVALSLRLADHIKGLCA